MDTPLPTDTTRQWHAMTRMFFLISQKKLVTPYDRHDRQWHEMTRISGSKRGETEEKCIDY